MRSLPILWRMAEDLRRLAVPSALFEYPFASTYRQAPWNQLYRLVDDDLTKMTKDGYQVSMNVAEFKPEELKVKVSDSHVIVEGKSEQQNDDNGGSYISRHFVRRVAVPTGFEADNVISTLSSDGVLTVSIPKSQIEEKAREIPIQCTDAPPKPKALTEESGKKEGNNN